MNKPKVAFIGASAGGITAIQQLIEQLPKDFDLPLVLVQHLPADMDLKPKLLFGPNSSMQIEEACDKMPLMPGHIYCAPAGYHLLIEKDFSFGLSQDTPVHHARPSIDVLFESAAVACGTQSCAVLMTGANQDGAQGLRAIQQSGGFTMVQDPQSAEFSTMPRSALDVMRPDHVGDIKSIAEQLVAFAKRSSQYL